MIDIAYDIVTGDMVLADDGDVATTNNPSVQYGYTLLNARAFNMSIPGAGVGFASEIYGADQTEMATELNRWVQQVESDGGDASWSTTLGTEPFSWDVNYLNGGSPTLPSIPSGTVTTAGTYEVQSGDTIGDVVLNSTGYWGNLDAILQANGATDWNPTLDPGQLMTIPAGLTTDPNTLAALQVYPACNNAAGNILTLIADLFNFLSNNWILATGFWNDDAVWIDTAEWIDLP